MPDNMPLSEGEISQLRFACEYLQSALAEQRSDPTQQNLAAGLDVQLAELAKLQEKLEDQDAILGLPATTYDRGMLALRDLALAGDAVARAELVAMMRAADAGDDNESAGDAADPTAEPPFSPGDRVISGGAGGAAGIVVSVDGLEATVRWIGEDETDVIDGQVQTVRMATLRAADGDIEITWGGPEREMAELRELLATETDPAMRARMQARLEYVESAGDAADPTVEPRDG